MAIDYSKRKSYQKIVSKAKSYDPRGKQSLKSQRERMRKRRKVTDVFFKDKNLGAKNYRAMEDSPNRYGQFMKMAIDKKASANTLLSTLEKLDMAGDGRAEVTAAKKLFSSIKTGAELEKEIRAEMKRQRRITKKNKQDQRQFYASSLIGP
tara:strand:- start:976 stop:1428 length:453 start_codon:yes stop_codon:yes gene_type:complete